MRIPYFILCIGLLVSSTARSNEISSELKDLYLEASHATNEELQRQILPALYDWVGTPGVRRFPYSLKSIRRGLDLHELTTHQLPKRGQRKKKLASLREASHRILRSHIKVAYQYLVHEKKLLQTATFDGYSRELQYALDYQATLARVVSGVLQRKLQATLIQRAAKYFVEDVVIQSQQPSSYFSEVNTLLSNLDADARHLNAALKRSIAQVRESYFSSLQSGAETLRSHNDPRVLDRPHLAYLTTERSLWIDPIEGHLYTGVIHTGQTRLQAKGTCARLVHSAFPKLEWKLPFAYDSALSFPEDKGADHFLNRLSRKTKVWTASDQGSDRALHFHDPKAKRSDYALEYKEEHEEIGTRCIAELRDPSNPFQFVPERSSPHLLNAIRESSPIRRSWTRSKEYRKGYNEHEFVPLVNSTLFNRSLDQLPYEYCMIRADSYFGEGPAEATALFADSKRPYDNESLFLHCWSPKLGVAFKIPVHFDSLRRAGFVFHWRNEFKRYFVIKGLDGHRVDELWGRYRGASLALPFAGVVGGETNLIRSSVGISIHHNHLFYGLSAPNIGYNWLDLGKGKMYSDNTHGHTCTNPFILAAEAKSICHNEVSRLSSYRTFYTFKDIAHLRFVKIRKQRP